MVIDVASFTIGAYLGILITTIVVLISLHR